MATFFLNKTNLEGLTADIRKEIFEVTGKDVTSCYTYRDGISTSCLAMPGDKPRVGKGGIAPFTMENEILSYEEATATLVVRGRNKWQRSYSILTLKGEKVGYKCKTASIDGGWIFGNFK